MHGVTEAHHLAQKIWPMAETLEDPGHLLTTGVGAPFVVDNVQSRRLRPRLQLRRFSSYDRSWSAPNVQHHRQRLAHSSMPQPALDEAACAAG